MGLLPRLLIAEVVVFVIVFGGGVFLINQNISSLEDKTRQERLLLGRAIAEDLDAFLDHGVMELQQLASGYRLAVAKGDLAEIQGALDSLARESAATFTRGVLIISADYTVLAVDQEHPGLVAIDLRRYWPNLSNEGRGAPDVLTEAFTLEGQASPSVAIAVPLGGQGNGGYVVGIMDTVDSYPARVVTRAVRLGGSGHADVVDHRGVALFSVETEQLLLTSDHPTSYYRLLGQGEPVIQELPHERDGVPQGEPHLMAFVPLKAVPWAVAIGTNVSEAFAPIRRLRYASLGFLVVLTGLAILATVFVGQKLVQPVKALSVAARGVAEGDRAVTVRIPWGGEIGELARSLETMRLRLQAWGSELEEQVRKRTSELEERNRELRVLYETLQRKEEQLHALLGSVLSAQEEERKRVSRELHDGIGQALSALSMGLERLEQAKPDQRAYLQGQAEALKELATDTLSDLRRMITALRPAALDDLGLVPAIRRYAELYLGNAGIGFQIRAEELDALLDPSLETVVYRVVQEAINNVARHSGATQVSIRLQSTGGTLGVTVEDNGQGFDSTPVASKHGVGLQGMEERASLAGGSLTVESRPGRGATVRLEIPLGEGLAISSDA